MATQITFNASDWMRRFEAAGGRAYIANQRLILGWMVNGCSEAQTRAARRILTEVQNDSDRLSAVREQIVRSLPQHLQKEDSPCRS